MQCFVLNYQTPQGTTSICFWLNQTPQGMASTGCGSAKTHDIWGIIIRPGARSRFCFAHAILLEKLLHPGLILLRRSFAELLLCIIRRRAPMANLLHWDEGLLFHQSIRCGTLLSRQCT